MTEAEPLYVSISEFNMELRGLLIDVLPFFSLSSVVILFFLLIHLASDLHGKFTLLRCMRTRTTAFSSNILSRVLQASTTCHNLSLYNSTPTRMSVESEAALKFSEIVE